MLKGAILATFILLAVVTELVMVTQAAAQTAITNLGTQSSVKNKTYDVWVSPSFASPPFEPFHDCFRFTNRQLCIDDCGDCGPLSQVPLLGIWQARVPCGGLNLVFIGTSMKGPATQVIGGSGVGRTQGTNFGVEGIANPNCSLEVEAATSTGTTPYSKIQ